MLFQADKNDFNFSEYNQDKTHAPSAARDPGWWRGSRSGLSPQQKKDVEVLERGQRRPRR